MKSIKTIRNILAAFLLFFVFIISDLIAQPKLSPKPDWLENGIIMAGNWEPLIFRRRRGHFLREDYVERYKQEHTEETVIKLKEQGVNFIMTHAYKGFGLEAEREDIEYAKILTQHCRKHGIKVGAYVSAVMFYETLFLEVPEAKEWIRRDETGYPSPYGSQSYRYRVNIFRKDFQEYMKKVVKTIIKELQPNLIHLDNFGLRRDPESDHSPYTAELFRQFLKEKYTPEELIERVGFSTIDGVRVPEFNFGKSTIRLQKIRNPLLQEWIDFRCHTLAEYYGEVAKLIKEIDPEIVVECNAGGLNGSNAIRSAIDFSRLLVHGNAFWTEEDENIARWTDDERLVSVIRSYKLGTILNNVTFSYTSGYLFDAQPEAYQLSIAEALAFNRQTPGMVCWMEEDGANIDPKSRIYLDFFNKNKALYMHTDNIADVAVLHSFPSMAFDNNTPHYSTILAEQLLIQKKIPFDIIFDANLSDLSKYKVLILADQELMADKELNLIREFVKSGGGLIGTNKSTIYNERRIRRLDFGLSDLFRCHYHHDEYYYNEKTTRGRPTSIVKNSYGKGRVVYVPEIVPSVAPPAKGFRGNVSNKYWKMPENSEELLDAIKWASKDNITLAIDSPDYVAAELLKQKDTGKFMLHFVNYNANETCSDIGVDIRMPENKNGFTITLYSPDMKEPVSLSYKYADNKLSFTVPEIKKYDLIVIQ
jgi:hypothetical protein